MRLAEMCCQRVESVGCDKMKGSNKMQITAGNSTYIDMWYHGMRDNCLCYTLTCHHCGFSVDPHDYEKGGGHRFCRGCGKYMFQNKHDYEAIPDLLDAVIDWTVPDNG